MTDWPKTGERLVLACDYDALAARLAEALERIQELERELANRK